MVFEDISFVKICSPHKKATPRKQENLAIGRRAKLYICFIFNSLKGSYFFVLRSVGKFEKIPDKGRRKLMNGAVAGINGAHFCAGGSSRRCEEVLPRGTSICPKCGAIQGDFAPLPFPPSQPPPALKPVFTPLNGGSK